MRVIYIDSDFKCHVANIGTVTAIETDFFDDKCDAFIEGYRFVPEGQSWIREDGRVFTGEMATPWKDYAVLAAYQEQYETMSVEMSDMQNALNVLGVEADG